MVLLDGLEGEEQEQQQHGETEDRSTPTAHQGTKTTEAVSHQDTVAHAEREREGGGGTNIMMLPAFPKLLESPCGYHGEVNWSTVNLWLMVMQTESSIWI